MAASTHPELARRLQGLNLYLVGMMGAGKSAVGRPLAEALGYRFLDADTVLESVAGRTIAEIFASDGEAGFRELETAVLDQISSWHSLVVATGGGVVTRPQNWGHLRQGAVVWLDAPAELLLARLRQDPDRRPLLRSENPGARLRSLLSERLPLYAQADLHVLQGGGQPQQVAEQVLAGLPDILRQRPQPPARRRAAAGQRGAPQPVAQLNAAQNPGRPDAQTGRWTGRKAAAQACAGGSSRTANHCTLRPGSSSSWQAVSSSRSACSAREGSASRSAGASSSPASCSSSQSRVSAAVRMRSPAAGSSTT